MRKTDTARLDAHAVVRHIEATGLKQWWIARQIGVDRKTVGRWVSGKVKRIARENLEPLAETLGCDPDDLIASDESDVLATREEQRTAARLIRERDLLQTLSPGDEWQLAESLIRATMEPHLPLSDLGHLYNQLSIAAWRQGHYDEGREHARRAAEIAERTRDQAVAHKASFNLATIASLQGDEHEARERLELCVATPEAFEKPRDLGAALSNLGCVYRTLLQFADSEATQLRAIGVFETAKLPFNLAIAYLSLSGLYGEWSRLDEAESAARSSLKYALEAGYERGATQAWFYIADAQSLGGNTEQAGETVQAHLPTLETHEIFDLGCMEIAARVYRRAGQTDAAAHVLERARARSEGVAVVDALLCQEGARLARSVGDLEGERHLLSQARETLESVRLDVRVFDAPIGEYGEGLRLSSPEA